MRKTLVTVWPYVKRLLSVGVKTQATAASYKGDVSMTFNECELVSVEIKDQDLVVSSRGSSETPSTRAFNIHQITSIKLEHDDQNDDNVRAYVGVLSQDRRAVFASRVIDKEFIGSVYDKEALDTLRTTLKRTGAPILEL